MELRIASTWSGEPLALKDEVSLTIRTDSDVIVLQVDAPYYGDPAPESGPGSVDGLWEYEVVEWFLVGEGQPIPYLEVELGPHGHHLVLQLEGVRNAVRTRRSLAYTAEITGNRWRGVARIPLSWLPPDPSRHNGFAIHGVREHRVYSAAYPVPGPHPDFHRLDYFGSFTG